MILASKLTYDFNQKKLNALLDLVFEAFCLSAKNIQNSSIFIIRNTLSNYIYDSKARVYNLKLARHQNEIDIFNLVNLVISEVNEKRTIKHKKKVQAFEEKIITKEPKLNLLSLLTEQITPEVYWQIVNDVLLENCIRKKEELDPTFVDYKSISSYIAQSAVQQVVEDFKNYRKSVVAYYKNPKSFTGKPEIPKYKEKSSLSTINISMHRFKATLEETDIETGEISKVEGFRDTFIDISSKNKIYTDFKKTKPLSNETVETYKNFPLVKLVIEEAKSRNKDFKVVEIKLIPTKSGKVRISYVVEVEQEISGLLKDFNELSLELNKKPINQINETQFKLTTKNLVDSLKEVPNFMSIDPGTVNFATLTYYTKQYLRANIIECSEIKKSLNNYQKKIDKITSNIFDEKSRSIQSKISSNKDNKGKEGYIPKEISQEEFDYLKGKYKELNSNIDLVEIRNKKQNKIDDFLHKISKAVIENAVTNKIGVIVVGRNKGRKNEINLSSDNNRNEHHLSHTRFLEILKYKGILNNILVIDVEESYTSITSFVHNESLQNYELAKGNQSQLIGKREKLKFITKDKTYHSDVNGSYNIARKAFKDFSYKTHIVNLNYNIIRINHSGKKKFSNIVGKTGKPQVLSFHKQL